MERGRLTEETLIRSLSLKRHLTEGGFYSEEYVAEEFLLGDGRPAMDTIYYMLTEESPVGHFHRNESDIVHFFHIGSPLKYTTISPDRVVDGFVLGTQLEQGQHLQRVVKAGYWKATELMPGDYSFGLISEAVVPAFSPAKRVVASRSLLAKLLPDVDEATLRLAWE